MLSIFQHNYFFRTPRSQCRLELNSAGSDETSTDYTERLAVSLKTEIGRNSLGPCAEIELSIESKMSVSQATATDVASLIEMDYYIACTH